MLQSPNRNPKSASLDREKSAKLRPRSKTSRERERERWVHSEAQKKDSTVFLFLFEDEERLWMKKRWWSLWRRIWRRKGSSKQSLLSMKKFNNKTTAIMPSISTRILISQLSFTPSLSSSLTPFFSLFIFYSIRCFVSGFFGVQSVWMVKNGFLSKQVVLADSVLILM